MIEDDDFPIVGLTHFDSWFAKVMFIMVFEKKVYTIEEWYLSVSADDWKDAYECGMNARDAVDEELSYWGD